MADIEDQITLSHNNILYDIGDTLVSINEDFEVYTKRAIENIFPFVGQTVGKEKFVNRVFEIRTEIRKKAHQTLYESSFLDFLKQINLEFQLNEVDFYKIELAYVESELSITKLNEGVHEILERGISQKKRQFIATNNFSPIHVKEILKRFELEKYFESVYISGEMNVRKPSIDFINTICQDSQLVKKDTIIIGDKLNMDILAANRSQIDSCWLNKNESSENEIKPTYQINNLKQLNF